VPCSIAMLGSTPTPCSMPAVPGGTATANGSTPVAGSTLAPQSTPAFSSTTPSCPSPQPQPEASFTFASHPTLPSAACVTSNTPTLQQRFSSVQGLSSIKHKSA
jgi:hypothetical protein